MSMSVEKLLSGLGLSGLEAEVYLAVLSNPGSTGYRISQLLGKAAPNIYKALNALVIKEAVLPDDGDSSRTYAALSVSELASRESKRISDLAITIEKELSGVKHRNSQEGLYSFSSVPQVLARAESMLENCRETVVLDGDSEVVRKLSASLEQAASRGVKVLIHGRAPLELEGCLYIPSVTEGWQGELLIMVVDSREYLMSFMSGGMTLLQKAVWSSNFIAPCIHRSYLCKAFFYRTAMLIAEEGMTLEQLRGETANLWKEWGYGDSDQGTLARILENSS